MRPDASNVRVTPAMMIFLRWMLALLARVWCRYRAFDTGVLGEPGPVLLVPNHTSWFDWMFLALTLDEDWKFVVSRTSAETSWIHRRIMLNRRTFPIDTTSPYGVKHMAEHLQQGGRLVLFAEGRISRTGSLMKLFDGTGFLLHKTRAKVILCYLRHAFRLPLSPNRERHQWAPRVTAYFSKVLVPPHPEHLSTSQGRELLTRWLRDQMVAHQFETEMRVGARTVPEAVLETARRRPSFRVLGDVTSQFLSYRRLMISARVLAGVLDRRLPAEPGRVGVLLPNVNANPVTLLALWSLGRVPAVLNYTSGAKIMKDCAELAGLTHVVSSRAFVEKARLDILPLEQAGVSFCWLEDVRREAGTMDRLGGWLATVFRPAGFLRRRPRAEDAAVVLFTSGSEGTPKGVMLSHANVLANIRQMVAVCDMQDWDRLFNALPLFHSFGLTIGTFVPLVRGLSCFLYPSPLHYRLVPTTVYFSDSTIMLATNTFLNGYARKAHPYDFRNLRYLFAGAEKVQETTSRLWAERFGIRILEGYGATECSPCLTACTSLDPCPGSAGRFLPGVEHRLEPVEGVTEGGRLFVRGPNVMMGYLNADANEAFQKLGGWYDTGDIAHVDERGFVHILGRMKRFAKVSGEMVSLTAVEEVLAGAFPRYGLRCQVAVISRPDEHKGEVLVGVTNEPRMNLDEVRKVIRQSGLSNLCVPREIRYVHEIPKLGTGKVNHRALEELL